MSFKSKLKKLDNVWQETREEVGESKGGYEQVPSGNYVVHKVKGEIKESKKGLFILRKATIKEGEYEGKEIRDLMNLENETGPEWVMKWLNFMGVYVDTLSKDLEPGLKLINENEGCTIQVSVKNDQFFNVYYNQIIEGGLEESEEEEDELSEMSRKELKAYIDEKDLDIKVTKKMSDDEIREAIEEALEEEDEDDEEEDSDEEEDEDSDSDEEEDNEKDDEEEEDEDEEEDEKPSKSKRSSKSKSKEKVSSKKKGKESDSKDEAKKVKAMKALCDAFGVDYPKKPTYKDLLTELKELEFKKAELEDDEYDLLVDIGLKKNVKGK